MAPDHPTYRLGDDVQDKLNSYVDNLFTTGYSLFSREFEKIDAFVEAAEQDQSQRDDHSFRRTPKRLYLIELINYKVYDDYNRKLFNATGDTLIILPDCLSLHNPECLKTDGAWGDECRECTPDCQAYEVMQLAADYNAQVLFSKRKLSEQLQHYAAQSKSLGVIGVACILMLADGMRTAMELGIPVRGVPLDFCGCDHWNDQPFASAFPMTRLEAILKEKYER
jgi:hypothetical protein